MKMLRNIILHLLGLRLTILPKIMISFLVVIIPISLLSLMMNQSGMNTVRQEILQSSASNVHFYLSSLETEINRILRLEREYISSDDDFSKAGVIPESMDDYERGLTILRIENKLSILKSSSPYIKDIRIYFPRLGRTIWTTSFSDTIPQEEIDAIIDNAKSGSPFTYLNNRLILGMVYPLTGQEILFTMEVELSIPLLRESLAQMSNKQNAGSILLNKGDDWYVSDKNDSAVLSAIRSYVFEQSVEEGLTLTENKRMEIENEMYLLYYERSEKLGLTLVHYVPEVEAMGVLNRYQTWYWFIVLASLIFVFVFSYGIFLLIHKPMRRLVNSLYQVGNGNLSLKLQHLFNDEFKDVYLQFNTMVSRIHTLIEEVSEQQTRSQRSELKQLQSQINPHFLYNSLFVLLSLIKQEDMHNAERLVMHMGNYFRNMTRNGEDEVALDKEMMQTQAYAGIQSVRFPDIAIHWASIPEGCEHTRVPRLILQPLVENAYMHGLEELDGPGVLVIEMTTDNGVLEISVEDNGRKLSDQALQQLIAKMNPGDKSIETTGIFNVHRRLQLRYGNQYGLILAIGQLGGLRVNIRIPLEQEGGQYGKIVDRR
ncbi:sensor histidine kinase [Paenibacillus sinopodophylli]|uniref:sensor histidine kinase n=1 Tax=Paenibacillus sinopodophylli TaxID=1837342 RepID=UPI00110CA054|nr:histidine kinase [Paenibacillus sinopodophylli]